MNFTFVVLALAASLTPTAAQTPRVPRTALASLEQKFDRAIPALNLSDPYDPLGNVRGVYLPGYGVVFTTELNLTTTIIMPFVPEMTVSDIQKLRQRKLGKLPALRQSMRQMMIDAAAALDSVPPSEQIVMGVTLFYRNFEMKEGLPTQIVMQAPRQKLLDYKADRIKSSQLDAAIQTQDLF